MIKHSALILALVAASGVLHSGSAEALVTTYTDRAAFQAAAGITTLEDFNSYTADTSFGSGGVVDVGDFTLSGTFGFPIVNNIDVPPFLSSTLDINGTPFANPFTGVNALFTIEFASAISAFGADFKQIIDNHTTTVDLGLGEPSIDIPFVDPGFFGFVSDTEFSSLTFTASRSVPWSLDNVEYTSAEAEEVPEPSTLMGLAALGLLRVVTRKRS